MPPLGLQQMAGGPMAPWKLQVGPPGHQLPGPQLPQMLPSPSDIATQMSMPS